MKVLSVLAIVLFVGANSFAQTGAAHSGTEAAAPAAATATTTTEAKADKPMKKDHHGKKAKHQKNHKEGAAE